MLGDPIASKKERGKSLIENGPMENDKFSSHENYSDCIGGTGPGDTSNLFCHPDIDTLISSFLSNLTNWAFCLTFVGSI